MNDCIHHWLLGEGKKTRGGVYVTPAKCTICGAIKEIKGASSSQRYEAWEKKRGNPSYQD